MFNFLSTRTSRFFPSRMLSSWVITSTFAQDCFSPGTELFISRQWTSCQPVSPACKGPSGWQHDSLVYQQFLSFSVIYNLSLPYQNPPPTPCLFLFRKFFSQVTEQSCTGKSNLWSEIVICITNKLFLVVFLLLKWHISVLISEVGTHAHM